MAGNAVAANYSIQYADGTMVVDSPMNLSLSNTSVNGRNALVISWPSSLNHSYQVQYRDGLSAEWTDLNGPMAGTGSTLSVTNSTSDLPQRFFRVGAQ